MESNSGETEGPKVNIPRVRDMEAFDSAPRWVRDAINQANYHYAALDICNAVLGFEARGLPLHAQKVHLSALLAFSDAVHRGEIGKSLED